MIFASVQSMQSSRSLTASVIHGVGEDVPLLRWAGSKKKLLPKLAEAVPANFKRYAEPFVGSAVLFLRLRPRHALLGDINADLIDTYRVVKEQADAVWRRASTWDCTEEAYYRVRSLHPANLSAVERAARFIYLNRYCFNGVYRTNRQGHFNVSRGKGHLGIPPLNVFHQFAQRLQTTDLRCGDFENVLSDIGPGDFCYLDPPYASSGNRDRGEYGMGSFKHGDLDRFAHGLRAAGKRGAKLLLSYSANEQLIDALPGWKVHRLSVVRNVAGFTDARRHADEVIISNYSWTVK